MTPSVRRTLEWLVVDTHLWVSAAAAGLTLFAAAAIGLPTRAAPMGVVFSATLLIYAVDDISDGRMRAQPARWLTVGLGGGSLAVQLLWAPISVVIVVVAGAIPALLYGVPIHGRRLRELPAVKPFFVSASLAVAAVAVPSLWAWSTSSSPAAPRVIATGAALFTLVLCNVCFFDLRDRVADERAGVRTIPVRLGVSGTLRLCLALSLGVVGETLAIGVLQAPLIAAALATAAYARFLSAPGGRLECALVVDGVPVLLGISALMF